MTTPSEHLQRTTQALIDAAMSFHVLTAQARTTQDALDRFKQAAEAPTTRESAATLAALADVDAGAQVAPSARKHGIQPSTLFRALKRRREAVTPPAG